SKPSLAATVPRRVQPVTCAATCAKRFPEDGTQVAPGALAPRVLHAAEEFSVRAQDALAFTLVRCTRRDVPLERSAEQHAIRAREHVDALVDHEVVYVGLRHKHGQLTLNRHQLVISEQCARAEPAAIEDYGLFQRQQLAAVVEFTHDDAATGSVVV